MPRFPREYINTSFLHVMTQGINKSFIFEKSEDIKYYIKNMYELQKEYNLKIIAYCIMNNHAHILFQINKIQDLSKYMQRLNTKYGKYYNNKYNRVGFVFRNRFKSEGIYNEKHLYSCIKYIYDNPVKAGICKKASEYPYSNFKNFNIKYTYDYIFLDADDENEKNIKKIINNYLNDNHINLTDLKKDSQKLEEIIKLLRDRYKISFRKISKEIDINREKIRKIYNQEK